MSSSIRVVIEKHTDGYVSYPLTFKGVIGQGNTFEEAYQDVASAIRFHLETFGEQDLDDDALEVFVAKVTL